MRSVDTSCDPFLWFVSDSRFHLWMQQQIPRSSTEKRERSRLMMVLSMLLVVIQGSLFFYELE